MQSINTTAPKMVKVSKLVERKQITYRSIIGSGAFRPIRCSSCIMSVQYTGDVQYNGGCSIHRRDIMSTVGDIMATLGVFSTLGGYQEYTGGTDHEYNGGIS